MIDFTNLPRRNKTYGGANGSKRSVIYQDEQYMLKFPPHPSRNRDMSYANSCLSEYLGCHIFALAGIPVQETLLGTYTYQGKEKIVVACKDFTSPGVVLQDFASMKNQVIDSERNGYGTELDDILFSIHEQPAIDPKELEERFWDMFIVDALIGNWDRHNGNWGVLYDTVRDMVALAPVFDCGSWTRGKCRPYSMIHGKWTSGYMRSPCLESSSRTKKSGILIFCPLWNTRAATRR